MTGRRHRDEESDLRPLYLRTLLRINLNASLFGVAIFALLFLGLPFVFWFFPAAGTAPLAGIPLVWWILGVAAYPVLVVIGWAYVRNAEAFESEFAEMVDPES